MAAKVVGIVLMRAIGILKEKGTDLSVVGEEECWAALLDAWIPLKHAWKVVWWEGVATPPDVADGDEFKDSLRCHNGITLNKHVALLCEEHCG